MVWATKWKQGRKSNMFRKLQKRLTFFYSLTCGIILAGILLVCFFYMKGAVESRNQALFSSLFLNISNQFQSQSFFSDQWLAQMETDNRLIIHVEENGDSLFFPGAWEPATDRKVLIDKAMEQASLEGLSDNNLSPGSTRQSALFYLSGNSGDSYCGMALQSATDAGKKTLLVLQDITLSERQAFFQGLFFAAAGILGFLLLGGVSWKFVGKTLAPLKESKQKQAEFIAAASHELRSPLAVIQASASAIKTSPQDTPAMIENIEKECSRMNTLIKDLLILASADSQKWNLTLELCDGDTLLLDVYEIYQPLCRQNQIPLELKLPDMELPKIRCDRNRIIQILSVLMDNAMSYTSQGKSIELEIFLEKKYLCFSVADHGKGIPDSEKEAVFDRFYQQDKSRNQKGHFGLGLPVGKELAKLHKGDLVLKDTPGGGCTFLLKIPFSEQP